MDDFQYNQDEPDLFKYPVVKCNKCKDTGIIKYKEIDELSSYQWVPWKTKKCECKK